MRILTYCVTVTRDDEPGPPFEADKAYDAREAHLSQLVQAGFAKLDAFRQKQQQPTFQDGIANAGRPLYIFAAPEWLFRVKRDQFGWNPAEYFMPKHRQQYRKLLASLSVRADVDVLMVAGSMLWIQPLDALARLQVAAETARYRVGKAVKYGFDDRTRPESRLEREADVFKAREPIITGVVKKEWLGYNEALVYFNGTERKSVLKSYNASDFSMFGAENPANHVEMVYGLGAGSFSLDIAGGKLKCAVAICYDHSRPLEYGKSVDLYILVSCSQSVSRKYVKGGGLILHSDCRGWGSVKQGKANQTLVAEKAEPFELARAVIDTG